MTTTPLRKVAFLDTNVLHFVGLYLRRARDQGLFPLVGDDVAAAKRHLSDTIENDALKSSLNKGLRVVAHLQSKNIRIEYSAVSELELMEGRARGKALEKARARLTLPTGEDRLEGHSRYNPRRAALGPPPTPGSHRRDGSRGRPRTIR